MRMAPHLRIALRHLRRSEGYAAAVIVALALVSVPLLLLGLPARRATSIDPAQTLREG